MHERKELMGSRIAGLMQAKTALLSSAAEARLQNMEQAYSDRLQHFKLEMADKECQVCPILFLFGSLWLVLLDKDETAGQTISKSRDSLCMRVHEG